jgi:hypothetical protein
MPIPADALGLPNSSAGVTRRKWLGQVATPTIAASVGAALLGTSEARAADLPPSPHLLGARIFDVREYGARGDGKTLDTASIQAAIDACTDQRGGVVLIPAGDFVVGTLELKSNVTLHLAAQGRLVGSADAAHYHAGRGIPTSNGNVVLLSAAEAENVTIEGAGTIDGNGAAFYTGRGDNTGPGANSAEGYFQRPHLLIFYRCRQLRLRGVFLTASAYHCTRILYCENVWIDGIRIHNRVNHNNDGFHFTHSRYVHVTNCDVVCQDDACALFGSNQFVTVSNCSFSTRWSIFRFGGGEARNITISNCVIYETYGCVIKMRCSARARFENITFSNLIMHDVTGPISIGLDSTPRRGRDDNQPATKGVVRNIAFNGIRATVVAHGRQHADLPFPQTFRPGEVRTCIVLNGVGTEVLENISFTDVHVTYEGGGTADEAAREVPPLAGEYFEIGTPPAYGLYARNVRGLTLHNVRFEVREPEHRPALVCVGVADASINGLHAQGDKRAAALIRLVDTRDVLFSASRLLAPATAFLQVEGPASEGIIIDGGDLRKAGAPVARIAGATEEAVTLRV